MTLGERRLLIFAGAVILLAIGLWVGTGRDYYTKFEVIEKVEKPIEANDPFAGTGFYDSNAKTEVVRRPAFRLGLLPTPAGLFDKHMLSVATLAGPAFLLGAVVLFRSRRRQRRSAGAGGSTSGAAAK